LSATFKTIVYASRPQLATQLFWVIAALSLLAKIFFTELSVLFQKVYRFVHSLNSTYTRWLELIFPILIVSILYVPDAKGVTARDFLGEQYHHWDSSVMTPGWAFLSGSVLNVDVISQYGLGLPILVAELSKLLGGFSYVHVLQVIILVNIIYYLAWYFLLRAWLKNIWVVMAGMLFAIKIEMFHALVYPIAFTYPSGTVLRYVFDVFVFALMFGHLRTGKNIYLWLSSIICGISLFYMTTTGLCLVLTWGTYLVTLMVLPDLRRKFLSTIANWAALIACLPLMAAAAAICLWFAQGQHMFTVQFWHNTQEFNNYFLSGFGTIPLQQNITDHNYLSLLTGLAMPLVYLATFLVVMSFYLYRIYSIEQLLAAFIAFYGLALFHYFMGRSMSTNTYDVGLPYAFVLCFWLSQLVQHLGKKIGLNISLAVLAVSAWALLTTGNYVAYPNVWNLSHKPLVDPVVFGPLDDGRSYFNHLFSQLPLSSRMPLNSLGETDEKLRSEKDFADDQDMEKYYDEEFDFSRDAKLIDALVPPGGTAPVISSFETKILMDANRRPFFYYSPLVISRLMRMRTMVVTALYTQGHFYRTIAQLEEEKPEYVFIERIFSKENMNIVNYQDGSAFRALMQYVHAHYEKYQDGYFLMALKRIS